MPDPIPPRQIVGNQEVRKMCGGITRTTLLAWRRTEAFPTPIRTLAGTPKTELWDARQVRAWLKQRAADPPRNARAGR